MRATLENLCNSFINNRNILNSSFKWENDLIVAASAAN